MITTAQPPEINIQEILSKNGFTIITNQEYAEYMRLKRNEEYLAKIDRGIEQAKNGTCTPHDIIEVDDDE